MAWNKSGSSWPNWNPNNSWGSWSDSHKNSWDQSQPESKWDQTKPSASITQTPVPSDFQADEEFLDNREKYGYKLHRKVQPTNWSRKRQLAGRPVEDISIVDITKNGWEEHALRVLSQGSFVTPVWARSTSEAVFAAGLFKKIREKKYNIDAIAERIWADSNTPPPSKHEHAIDFMTPLVDKIMSLLDELHPVAQDCTALKKIQSLEAENARFRAKGVVLTPEKHTTTGEKPGEENSEPGSSVHPAKKRKVQLLEVDAIHHPKQALEDPPSATTDKAMQQWLENIKKHMDKEKASQLDKYVKQVVEHHKGLKSKDLGDLRALAIKWGLPYNLAEKASNKSLSQIVAAAALQAA